MLLLIEYTKTNKYDKKIIMKSDNYFELLRKIKECKENNKNKIYEIVIK